MIYLPTYINHKHHLHVDLHISGIKWGPAKNLLPQKYFRPCKGVSPLHLKTGGFLQAFLEEPPRSPVMWPDHGSPQP